MDRKEIMARLRGAKSAHIQWRSYAQGLLAGIPLDEDKVPVAHTDCRFGKWYYGEGQLLATLPTYAAIEGPHDTLHAIYRNIVEALFGEVDQPTLVQRLFGKRAKSNAQRRAEAEALMTKLIGVSETLLTAIDLLEQELKELSDQELVALAEAPH